ncbi:MAG: TonB-dependent receptor plug domain-containing protein [Paludibacter sp.]
MAFRAVAQPADTLGSNSVQKQLKLREVKVLATQPEKLTTKNASFLTQEDIQAVGSENFINVADQLPGIMKVQETTFPLLIRGMYGSRIHVEKNGLIKTGIDQSGYLLEDINPNEISDVQLLHGARSIAYGSGSVGGVLLINEKTALKKGGISGNAKTSYGLNNNERSADARLSFANEHNALTVGGRYTIADDFHYAKLARALNSSYEYKNATAKYAHQFENGGILEWNNNFYSGERHKPVGFQNNPYDYRSFSDKYNIESSLKYKTNFTNGIIFNGNLWYNGLNTNQQQDELNAGTKLLAFRDVYFSYKNAGGIRLKAAKKHHEYWLSEIGIDTYTDHLQQDHQTSDMTHKTESFKRNYALQQQTLGGIFALSEYENNRNSLFFSLRGDIGGLQKNEANSVTYKNISGGIDWQHKLNSWLTNDLSLSRHFRFPIPMEAVGTFYGGRGVFVGNPGIQPETSYNLEWVLKGSASHFRYWLNGWSSFFFNRITEYELFTNKYTYVNIARSRLFGFDGSLSAWVGNSKQEGKLEFSSNCSYSIGDDVSTAGFLSKGTPLEGIPPGRIRTKLHYFKNWKFVEPSVFVVFSYIASYDRLPVYPVTKSWGQNARNAYGLWDVGFNLNFPTLLKGITVSGLVNNVLDPNYLPYGGYLRGMGRNIKITLNMRF